MGNWDHHCPNCFSEKTDGKLQCQSCDYDEGESRSPAALPVRTILNNQYVVGRILGNPGGFGITYLCWDIMLSTRVAIKEFMPRDNAVRDRDQCSVVAHSGKDREFFEYGLKAFLAEARTVAGFDHPNIVRIRTYFEQNHTAYLVMDYYEGVSLAEYVKQQGGRLPEKAALGIMGFVLDGLRHVHDSGYLHRDIKPANIYLTGKGQVILLDFGAARYAMGEHSRSLSVVVTPGFSPFEQYSTNGKQGPWTDIYASGATLYYMLTGNPPESAPDRILSDTLADPVQLLPDLPPGVNKGIMRALRVKASDRPQSIEELKKILSGSPQPVPAVNIKKTEGKPDKKEKREEVKKTAIPIWRSKVTIALGLSLLVFLTIVYGDWGRTGILVVNPYPDDAEVMVDGVYQGRGWLRLEKVISGKRMVSAKLPGYGGEPKTVEVTNGRVAEVEIRLMALEETLKIVTEPSGAEISVNEVVKGKSPLVVMDIKPGSAKVRASMNTKEYAVREEVVNIETGREMVLEWKLTQLMEHDLTLADSKIGNVWKDPVTGMGFVWAPSGCYQMGCGSWDEDCQDGEKPVHEVCVDGFWIAQTEVTQGQWQRVMGKNPSSFKKGDDYPVEAVSWYDTKEYIRKLNEMGSAKFRLPSEAEWEYAARSGGKAEKYSGGNDVDSVAWYDGNDGDSTHPVKTKKGNGLGIYDMSGNVWEWVEDVYIADIYKRSDRKNPIYTSGGSFRMFRGGSWSWQSVSVRCAKRLGYEPASRLPFIGFRLLKMP
jgi:formylglycine-generating enzyme required for sulfatase activity/serine/threonine protein kinase